MSPAGSRSAANDPRNKPAYTVAEAARYLKVAPVTLRSWFAGREYPTGSGAQHWARLLTPASDSPTLLSFWNLVEAHVLRGLRADHQVSVTRVREAIAFSGAKLGIERVLLSKELFTSARSVFLRHYGQLIDLSASGQIAMEHVLDAHMRRVEWESDRFPVRLYPFLPADVMTTERIIAIDPAIAFGRPILEARGITTAVLADRVDAGETIADVAADYEMTVEDVERAIVYERAA